MVAVTREVRLFPLIGEEHPFFPQVCAFAEQIAARAENEAAPAVIHSEIKALRSADSVWVLDRFYWSRQIWDAPGAIPFSAETLTYRAGTGLAEWHDFPRDAYLGAIGAGLTEMLASRPAARVEVLRYVPLRRLTFRLYEGETTLTIGKFKRRSRYHEAHNRLLAVAQAAARQRAPFRVAAPVALRATYGLSLQEALPGYSLADLIVAETGPVLLYRLGKIHRALHRLEVPGLPAWDESAFRVGVDRDMAWIGFIRPDLAEDLAHAKHALDLVQPSSYRTRLAFCHGDFVPSQLLIDGDKWAVVDFDLCRQGNPYQELALLIAALPYDVPALRAAPLVALERLAACYLAGYQERADGHLNSHSLLWYRVCAELYYLSVALKKDWLDLTDFDRAVSRLRGLIVRLEQVDLCERL